MKRFLLIALALTLFPAAAGAKSENQFVTIVNPVRISRYNSNPAQSLISQYSVIRNLHLPATWLVTFDILSDSHLVNTLKTFEKEQELGIFLEVSPALATSAGVVYHDTGSWHYANSVFLSGYDQSERLKLIDTVFAKFKANLGYYPTSVGSWWTDAYSLSYMQKKYGITANLTCADQFATDNYQLWGQYWSTPFYPSKLHSGVPAGTVDTKLNVVNLQWAARDPVNGYYSSLYSTQDYFTTPQLTSSYFEKLLKIYYSQSRNAFGQITVGLEGDFSPDSYQGTFKDQMTIVASLANAGTIAATNMSSFSRWYLDKFPDLSPPHLVESSDLLDTSKKAQWYQSPHYRIGVIGDQIVDLRIYGDNLVEPYYTAPNRERSLFINIPAVINDQDTGMTWDIKGTKIEFFEKYFTLHAKKINVPVWVKQHPGISIKNIPEGIEVSFNSDFLQTKAGKTFVDWKVEATHAMKSPRFWLNVLLRRGPGLGSLKKQAYFVSQDELGALAMLFALPPGRVLVVDHECLQCAWHSSVVPAAFGNRRSYVQQLANKQIVYNSSVFNQSDRAVAKKNLQALHAKYVYLVKYEDYIEKMPFSPGDLGVKMIYENANAQIWKVL